MWKQNGVLQCCVILYTYQSCSSEGFIPARDCAGAGKGALGHKTHVSGSACHEFSVATALFGKFGKVFTPLT